MLWHRNGFSDIALLYRLMAKYNHISRFINPNQIIIREKPTYVHRNLRKVAFINILDIK